MKTLLTTAILTLTLNAYGQTNSSGPVAKTPVTPVNAVAHADTPAITDTTIIKIDPSLPNGIMLNGTQMVIVKNGIMRKMKKDIVLSNGTRVKVDGYILRKNRYAMLLNYGEYVDASGNILPITSTKTANK